MQIEMLASVHLVQSDSFDLLLASIAIHRLYDQAMVSHPHGYDCITIVRSKDDNKSSPDNTGLPLFVSFWLDSIPRLCFTHRTTRTKVSRRGL